MLWIYVILRVVDLRSPDVLCPLRGPECCHIFVVQHLVRSSSWFTGNRIREELLFVVFSILEVYSKCSLSS